MSGLDSGLTSPAWLRWSFCVSVKSIRPFLILGFWTGCALFALGQLITFRPRRRDGLVRGLRGPLHVWLSARSEEVRYRGFFLRCRWYRSERVGLPSNPRPFGLSLGSIPVRS